ncbi:MAG: DUF1109 domain-containing protein [Salinarimonas sp.]|nr:DUF1109 domain-containing protein [Salinarimonas sp.]
MKTDQLIAMLARDGAPRRPLRDTFCLASAAGLAVALVVFFVIYGFRPDLAAASGDIRLWVKIATPVLLAAGAGLAMAATLRPESHARRMALIAAPLLISLAVIGELFALPAAQWGSALVGDNAVKCLVSIPLLAAAPFIALMQAARSGASTRPALTGAVIGLAAAGCGAALYALFCPDDSPLFVATWYSLAALGMAGIGALVGQRWLRW